MNRCVPQCWKKNEPASSSNEQAHAPLTTEQTQICFKCKSPQSVAKDATVYVCMTCHSVNRLNLTVVGSVLDATTTGDGSSIAAVKGSFMSLRRINSSTFVPLSDGPIAPSESTAIPSSSTAAPSSGPAAAAVIGPCSICLDAPGDMIFLKCNHGGFCEACARHIAGNKSVGGALCVKCRSPIEQVVRIVEMNADTVRAVAVEVQTEGRPNQPPRVPPPRGFNKSKKH